MTDYANTQEIQEESLVNFMASLGYEPVFGLNGVLMRFRQPRFDCVGQGVVGLTRAIKMHNTLPDSVWKHVSTVNTDFVSFLNSDGGEDMMYILAAGATRIVTTVKGKGSKKKGFFVDNKGDHMVKFQTEKDYMQYRHWVGE